jgi:GINS complex subunit 2
MLATSAPFSHSSKQTNMETCEVEFLAERELISITPNFDLGVLHLISGDFGPFKAGLPAEVPLWVAINLRQRRKCRIMAPDWLNVEMLELIKEREKDEK